MSLNRIKSFNGMPTHTRHPERTHWPLQSADRKVLLLSIDIVLTGIAILSALWLGAWRSQWPFSVRFVLEQVPWMFAVTAFWLMLARVNDLYDLKIAAYNSTVLIALSKVTLQALLIYLVIYFLSPPQSLPRHVIVFFVVFAFILVGAWRWTYATTFTTPSFRPRTLVVGAGRAGRTIVNAIQEHRHLDYNLIGFIDDDEALQGQLIEGLPVLGTYRNLPGLAEQYGVSEIVLAVTRNLRHELFQALLTCHEHGINIIPMSEFYEQTTGRVPVEHIGDDWYVALPLTHSASANPYRWLKRLLDILLALFGLVVTAPLCLILAIAIRLDTPGPVLYRQARVGRGGQLFNLIKFRSMITDAEKHNQAEWASPSDPRITRVGRIIRQTHLDELPQLINILRGEMSFIGPRPERPEFVAKLQEHIPFYRTRFAVRPGLTGWAQVRYGYGSSVEDALVKLQYDLYYAKHQSLSLDLLILFKSIGEVLLLRGR